MSQLWDEIGITQPAALATVLTTTVMYLIAVGILRRYGQRFAASPSSLDMATAAVLGAVIGRTMLGPRPTLAGGLLALATLVILEGSLSAMRAHPPIARRHGGKAVLLMAGAKPLIPVLRRYGLREMDLWAILRQKGIAQRSEVAAVILEPDGRMSVLARTESGLDPAILYGVRGAEAMPPDLFAS
ncbi:DUF421 domain-containing protein [Gephyromycinifex aptenodytis]|uniref:DUF421 domain-containing protein n=1 Tax=Gephyromycinifex aptenodytis TaxID=2716227 RepID=UPI0014450DA0|nr:YetF domain-containing protein [Gephyromycinifex aptenodytis]